MSIEPMPFWESCREDRRKRGWTQVFVAEQIGTHQSSISAFESGRLDALARGKIVQLGELLGLDVEKALDDYDLSGRAGLRVCLWRGCPSARMKPAGELVLLIPCLVRITSRKHRHCAACGNELKKAECPACHAALHEGEAFCRKCGEPFLRPLTPAEWNEAMAALDFVERREAVVGSRGGK